MKKRAAHHFLMTAVASALLIGCASQDSEYSMASLLPMLEPAARSDLDDGYVISAIQDYLTHKNAPSFTRYDFTRIDLDQDGWRDALVHLSAPYGQWCDTNGCTVVVFHAKENGFTLAGEIESVRTPFYASTTTTEGWHDLVVRVSGREEKAKDVVLRYDGEQYSDIPEDLPASDKKLHPVLTNIFP